MQLRQVEVSRHYDSYAEEIKALKDVLYQDILDVNATIAQLEEFKTRAEAVLAADDDGISPKLEGILRQLKNGHAATADYATTAGTAETATTLSGLTATVSELNKLDGVTATTAEINKLDGLTATTTELNYVDGVTSAIQDQIDDKPGKSTNYWQQTDDMLPYVSSSTGNLSTYNMPTAAEARKLKGLTATTAELNILDGVTATAAEINKLDGLTATTTELNYVDGVTSAIQDQLDGKACYQYFALAANATMVFTLPSGYYGLLATMYPNSADNRFGLYAINGYGSTPYKGAIKTSDVITVTAAATRKITVVSGTSYAQRLIFFGNKSGITAS